MISGEKTMSCSDMFASYVVSANEETEWETKPVKAEVAGAHPRKSRKLHLIYDGTASAKQCEQMARWEMLTRQAESCQYSVKVPGWFTEPEKPWALNKFVALASERLRASETLLITKISFDYSKETGHTTTLDLRHPDSLRPKPYFPREEIE